MSVAVVLGILGAVLFGLAFFTKRRFGLLGLALAAGSVLSNLWTARLTPLVEGAGIELVSPPLQTVVGAILIILPALLLLFRGRTYKNMRDQVIGASAFTLLALGFLLPTLGNALVLQDQGATIFAMLNTNRSWIITAGLGYALFDILTTKPPKPEKEKH